MKKTLIAAVLALAAPLAHADYESAMKIQNICEQAGGIGVDAYQAHKVGMSLSDVQALAANKDAPNTEWARAIQKVMDDSINYGWNKATSAQDAGSVSYAKCLDTLSIYQ